MKESHKKVKVVVAGASGRMGMTILRLAHEDHGLQIVGAFERAGHPAIGRDIGELIGADTLQVPVNENLVSCVEAGQVVIDFTHPDAVQENLAVALKTRKSLVIGTTGLSKSTLAKIKSASNHIAIVQSPNMSVGVNLLFRLASLVAKTLDDRYDVEIVEEHHRHKKDAPSGTALELGRVIAAARGVKFEKSTVYGRKGITGTRRRGEIGIHALRGGDTVGLHTASFIADGERVELVHRASSREAFAMGALLAAKFVAKKKTGIYNMQNVLGL